MYSWLTFVDTIKLVKLAKALFIQVEVDRELLRRERHFQNEKIYETSDTIERQKRGLPGFINGLSISALADTGAAQNVISAAFARKQGLVLENKPTMVRLGNSRRVLSVGMFEQTIAMVTASRVLAD